MLGPREGVRGDRGDRQSRRHPGDRCKHARDAEPSSDRGWTTPEEIVRRSVPVPDAAGRINGARIPLDGQRRKARPSVRDAGIARVLAPGVRSWLAIRKFPCVFTAERSR
jgi:hypothetical protein